MPLLGMGISDVRTGISKSSWSVKAYNNSEAEKSVFSVDRTAPKIEVEYDNNNVKNEFYHKEARISRIIK